MKCIGYMPRIQRFVRRPLAQVKCHISKRFGHRLLDWIAREKFQRSGHMQLIYPISTFELVTNSFNQILAMRIYAICSNEYFVTYIWAIFQISNLKIILKLYQCGLVSLVDELSCNWTTINSLLKKSTTVWRSVDVNCGWMPMSGTRTVGVGVDRVI